MTKKQKKMLIRIIVAAVLLVALHFIPVSGIARFLLYLVPYGIIGYDILRKAWNTIARPPDCGPLSACGKNLPDCPG